MLTRVLPITIVWQQFVLIYSKKWGTTKPRSNTIELRLRRRPASRNRITSWRRQHVWLAISSRMVASLVVGTPCRAGRTCSGRDTFVLPFCNPNLGESTAPISSPSLTIFDFQEIDLKTMGQKRALAVGLTK